MKHDRFDSLLLFLHRLDRAKIHYKLDHYREDALSVRVVVPGERWEIDFLDDGTVEVECFVSNGEIYDETMVEDLFARFSDEDPLPEETVSSDDPNTGK
jgi:hypothetical protein